MPIAFEHTFKIMVRQIRTKNIEHGCVVPGAVHHGAQFCAQLLSLSRFTAQNRSHVTYDASINLRNLDFHADHTLIASTTTMGC